MSVSFYMDHHVHAGITVALSHRGLDVLTAADDEAGQFPDEKILELSTALCRVLCTNDLWSDYIIHRIHGRVLNQVKALSESRAVP